MDYIPYAYLIGWTKLDKYYYGIEFGHMTKTANPANLWSTYFTSSNVVSDFRKEHGEPDLIQVRKTFTNQLEAMQWETKFLNKVDAKNNPKFLNCHNSDGLSFRSPEVSESARAKMSAARLGVPHSEEQKANMSKARLDYYDTEEGLAWKEYLSERMKTNNPSKKGRETWNKGVPHTEEAKEKMSVSIKASWDDDRRAQHSLEVSRRWESGVYDNRPKPTPEQNAKRSRDQKAANRKQSDYQKQRVSEAHRGKTLSEETKMKIRDAQNALKNQTKTCQYCGYIGYGGTFTRYHGENCKKKPSDI